MYKIDSIKTKVICRCHMVISEYCTVIKSSPIQDISEEIIDTFDAMIHLMP